MMVEQFIDRLEQQGLLDKETLADLRRKVARAKGKKITPEALAKYLVDRGHLTRFQAIKLVGDVSAVPDSGPVKIVKPKADEKAHPDEFQLLPDDLVGPMRETLELPTGPAPDAKSQARNELDELTAIDDDILSPKPNAAPVAKPADTPVDTPVEPKPQKAKAAPVAKPAPRKPEPAPAPPPAPVKGPEPPPPVAPPADDLLSDLETTGRSAAGGSAAKPPLQRKLHKASEWDSVLLLVGGASLGVLLVIGAFLYMSLTRGAAEDMIGAAETAYGKESYTEAIRLYDDYLEAHPRHEKASRARVFREIARLRQVYRTPDQGLKVAQEALPQIETEESFPDAREELASILPQIARGFVDAARVAKETAAQQALLAKAAEAMKLVDNANYVTSEHRKTQQASIDAVVDGMARVQREIDRAENLNRTLAAITAAVDSGDTASAYRAREELLAKYPGLDNDEQLLAAVLKISEKERERVQITADALQATPDDSTPPALPQVLLTHRMGQPLASVQGRVIYSLAGGSVFALDAATGDVLWRRFVGFDTVSLPQPIALNQPGADALVVDQRKQQIMRLEARTGKMIWSLGLNEPFTSPVVVDGRIYVSARSGKIYLLDAATGKADRQVVIPQPLEVATGVGVGRPQLYQVAEQDNLYVLSTETQACQEAFYVGHRRGTVNVPPVMALGFLFVAENAGADYSFLHILRTDEQGLHLKSAQPKIRLKGQVLVPPIVSKDKVLVVTDRREIDLFEVTLNSEGTEPVTLVVQQTATSEAPIISYSLMDSGYMWVANNRLAKFQVQNSAGKIPSEWVLDEGDVYLSPLQLLGDVVVHTRRRQNAPGVTVAAVRASEQLPVWQTEIAVPARSIFVQGDKVDAVTARGRCFNVAPQDNERSIVSAATASAANDERIVLSLTEAANVGNGEWSFGVAPAFSQVVFYRGAHADGPLRLATLAIPIGDAMLPPVPFSGGLVAPLKDGTVTCMDPVSGGPKLQPFHPSVPTGKTTQWNPPTVLDGGQEFIITSSRGLTYRVGLKDRTQLAELGSRALESEVVGPLASTGAACYLTLRNVDADTVTGLATATLATAKQWPLKGRLQWGPIRVGEQVWVATESELLSFDGAPQQQWQVPLEHAPPVGQPLVSSNAVWVATVDGFLLRIDPATGAVSSTLDVGEPLAGGPVAFGERMLVAARSGAVLVITPPGA